MKAIKIYITFLQFTGKSLIPLVVGDENKFGDSLLI